MQKDNRYADFPRPLLILNGALEVLAYSRAALPIFGVGHAEAAAESVASKVAADADLGDNLALATARLLQPGAEESFHWEPGETTFEVSVCSLDEDEFLVLFSDDTDHQLNEEIQLNARHYLERILSDIPIGVTVLNVSHRITSANRQMMDFLQAMGRNVELTDVIGSNLSDLVGGEVGMGWQRLCERAVENGERLDDERRVFKSNGGELVLASEVTPLRGRGRDVEGAILICENVTERTRLEREVVRMEKLATVGEMVITVNHEINNPLTIISTNAQSLRILNRELDEKSTAKLLTIEEQVKRISEVTERLRTMDEVTSGDYIADGPRMIHLWGRPGEDADAEK